MDVPIITPALHMQVTNDGRNILTGGQKGYTEGANTLWQGHFVSVDANQALIHTFPSLAGAPAANGATPKVLGWNSDGSTGDTALNPPYTMHGDTDNPTAAFQKRHWPQDVRGVRFGLNISTAAGLVGQAAGAPTLTHANCIVGKELALVGALVAGKPRTMVAIDTVANPMVRIVEVPSQFRSIFQPVRGVAYNGIVIVEFLDSVIQQA